MRVLPGELSIHPGSYRHGGKGNRAVGAGGKGGCVRQSANQRAVRRVNAEQAPRSATRGPTRSVSGEGRRGLARRSTARDRLAGVLATARWEGFVRNMGDPPAQGGRPHLGPARVPQVRRKSEGFIVPLKPVKAGGGKGPWFWACFSRRGESGDWAT